MTASGIATRPRPACLKAIAAAFVGGVSFKVGKLNVLGSIVAIFFLAVNTTDPTFAGVQVWTSELFTGLALVTTIGFGTVLHPERRRKGPSSAQASA